MIEPGELQPRRLRLARAALTVNWDPATVARLAGGLAGRQRLHRLRRRAAGVALGAAVIALAVGLPVRRAHLGARAGSNRAMGTIAAERARDRRAAGDDVELRPLSDLAAGALAAGRWSAFLRHPHHDAVLPDVSEVGHHPYGDAPAPAVIVDVRSARFGAAGDGVTDDTAAIQRAIDSVEESGGVVYFPDGEYRISDILRVYGSGIVLRGQHRRGARLAFQRPLDEALGPNVAGPFSRWRWSGGLVWFGPRSRPLYAPRGKPLGGTGEGWPVGAPLVSLAAPAARGDRTLSLAAPAPLQPGDLIMVVLDATEEVTAAGWRAERDGGHQGSSVPPTHSVAVRWPVEVAAVDGRTVTLAQPLRFDAPLELRPHLHGVQPDGLVRDVGIEHLGLVMRPRPIGPGQPVGWNGVFFQNAVHAFARDLTIVDCDLALGSVSAKNLSLTDVDVVSRSLPPDRPPFRALALRSWSHDVLVERVQIGPPWSGLNLEGTGFVLSRVRGRFDRLAGFAIDALLTDVLQEPVPEERPESLRGLRVVGWNLRTEGEEASALPSAVPANLYEAQKARRQGQEP